MASYDAKSKNAYDFYFTAVPGNIYNPVAVAPTSAVGGVLAGGSLSSPLLTLRTKTSSAAIADTLSMLGDTVLLTVGARNQKIESYGYDYTTGVQNAAYSASRVTPVAGLVFKATSQISLYATYIEGLIAGDTAPPSTTAQPVANPGQIFKPYQSKQTELGAKFDLGKIGGTVSVFQTRKPTYALNTTTNIFGESFEQKNRGLELSAFGEPIRGLRVLGGVTFLDTDVQGNQAIGSPKTQANVGAEWDVPGVRNLSINGRVTYTSSQFADAANTQKIPDWTRLDVGARYILDLGNQQITIRARIDNLTNRNYWASAGGYPGSSYLTVGAPRTFMLSGSINF
jgi:iron complex outermembrane receptor protein